MFNAFAMGRGSKFSSEVISDFFYLSSGVTLVASIFISMRLLAEERQTGTISLLYSSPIRDAEIVGGKFLSAFAFLALMTALTFFMPLLVLVNGKISFGHLAAGYLGLLLLGAASVAIGTLGSALAKNQVLAVILSGVMVVFLLLSWLLAQVTDRPFSELFTALALHGKHFQPFQKGIVHVRDVVYYLAVTWIALFSATRVIEARRWR
jgi:ABC-2 type transport system permease protein